MFSHSIVHFDGILSTNGFLYDKKENVLKVIFVIRIVWSCQWHVSITPM